MKLQSLARYMDLQRAASATCRVSVSSNLILGLHYTCNRMEIRNSRFFCPSSIGRLNSDPRCVLGRGGRICSGIFSNTPSSPLTVDGKSTIKKFELKNGLYTEFNTVSKDKYVTDRQVATNHQKDHMLVTAQPCVYTS